jgi:hypothetical protein
VPSLLLLLLLLMPLPLCVCVSCVVWLTFGGWVAMSQMGSLEYAVVAIALLALLAGLLLPPRMRESFMDSAQAITGEDQDNGSGRAYYLNQRGFGGGGHVWGEITSNDVPTSNMTLDFSGSVWARGNVSAPTGTLYTGTGGYAPNVSNYPGVFISAGSNQNAVIAGDIANQGGFTIGCDQADSGKFKIQAGGSLGKGVFTNPAMTFMNNYVGIGTTTPVAPLHVATFMPSYQITQSSNHYFNGGSTALAFGPAGPYDVSIFANNSVLTGNAFVAFSDRRIKVVRPRDVSDLDIIDFVNVVKYDYKDQQRQGTKAKIGYIAQQVREILPDAVGLMTETVPDVYRVAEHTVADTITLSDHGLTTADKVRIITDSGQDLVLSVSGVVDEHTFRVDLKGATLDGRVFVYGREVDDFHVLDYDMLSAVAFGGVKELNRMRKEQDEKITALTALVHALDEKVTTLVNTLAV